MRREGGNTLQFHSIHQFLEMRRRVAERKGARNRAPSRLKGAFVVAASVH
jgi:hypothetical protein